MIEWVVLSASVAALIVVVASLLVGKRVFNDTFEREREATFRRTLRMWNWSESEIDRAVEEQGWS